MRKDYELVGNKARFYHSPIGEVVEGYDQQVNDKDTGNGLNMQDVSTEITRMNPSRYPLDTITRENVRKTITVQSQEIKYHQQSALPMSDTLDATATGAGSNASAPASAHNFTTSTLTEIFVQVTNPKMFRPKDTIIMRDCTVAFDASGNMVTTGTITGVYDQMYYVVSISGNVLELLPIGGMVNASGDVVVPTFTATTVIYRMGSAMAEKDAKTLPIAMSPKASINYCQNFMTQIEQSTFDKMTKKEANVSFSDLEADALYNMRGNIEMSCLFGTKFKYDNGSDRTYFTDGIVRQISKTLEYGTGAGNTTLTAEDYTNWLKSVFTGNDGSSERVLLAGSELITSIELLRESEKQISGKMDEETYLGVRCTRIVSSFGTLRVLHEPLFDECGWEAKGLILDTEHLYKHVFVPMTAKDLDFKSSGEKNADAKLLQEVSCLVLRYPDCHAIIAPKE